MRNLPPPAKVLPLPAAMLLQLASQTPITRSDPLARVKAIEKATKRVTREYPEFFKQES